MAQIIKSEGGYWIGKEIHPGEQYMSFDKTKYDHPSAKIVPVKIEELHADIALHLGVVVSAQTPDKILRLLADELCHSSIGMIYVIDYKSPFQVRKVVDPPYVKPA